GRRPNFKFKKLILFSKKFSHSSGKERISCHTFHNFSSGTGEGRVTGNVSPKRWRNEFRSLPWPPVFTQNPARTSIIRRMLQKYCIGIGNVVWSHPGVNLHLSNVFVVLACQRIAFFNEFYISIH